MLYAQGAGWDAARRTFACERQAQQAEHKSALPDLPRAIQQLKGGR